MLIELIKGAGGAIIGAVIGSYLATSALRWGRKEGAMLGRSHCDHCLSSLTFLETVPVISGLVLKGRCRTCQTPIDRFHLVGEIGGALVIGLILALRPWPIAALESGLALMLLWLALIDIKTLTLPNILVLSVAAIGGILAYSEGVLLENSLIALGLGLVLSALAWGLYRLKGQAALGVGDIKLITALSLWLGSATIYVLVLASFAGLVYFSFVRSKKSGPVKIPFGPSLAVSGLLIGLFVMPVLWGVV